MPVSGQVPCGGGGWRRGGGVGEGGRPAAGGGVGGQDQHNNITQLVELNADLSLDANTLLNNYISEDENISQCIAPA
jgi:hypothetical protein